MGDPLLELDLGALAALVSPTELDNSPMPGLDEWRASLARDSLRDFIHQAWPLVEPGTPMHWNWHLDELCKVLEAVTRGEMNQLIINVPPGTSKSLTVSVFWPAWEWGRDPTLRYLCASYGAHLSIRDNLKVRSIIESPWYRATFPMTVLSSAQNAKERFDTTEMGWRIATSVEGVATGEHPDRIIIDDPMSAEQAKSEAARKSVNRWMDQTISTRGVSRGARRVVIAQRLHEDDLCGHLLRKGGWTLVMFPMRFDPSRADPRDPRVEAGSLLWPSLFPEVDVRRLEIELNPFGAAGQLQQRPVPEGGGLFKREWFPIVHAAPARPSVRCRGWDTAATENGGDYTVGALVSIDAQGIIYVEDIYRGQISPHATEIIMGQKAQTDGHETLIREEREPGSAGVTVIAARTRKMIGYDYGGVPTTGSKATRADPFRAQAEAGNVRLVSGPWNEAYLQEISVFDAGMHDDQVDATSTAFNACAERVGRRGGGIWGEQRQAG